MRYDIFELQEKIEGYFERVISKEELGKWAERAYYDLLTGGYLERKKIILYPFLKLISKVHIEKNEKEDKYPCSEKEIIDVKDILKGEKDYDFVIESAIPIQIFDMFSDNMQVDIKKRGKYNKLYSMLVNNYENGISIDADVFEYIYIASVGNETIMDILEEYIVGLCKALFVLEDNRVESKTKLSLYALKEVNSGVLKKCIEYLECYLGKRNFLVLVKYNKGVPQIQVLI